MNEDRRASPLERDDVHELLEELGTVPTSDTRIGRARARALDWAYRVTTWGPTRPVAEVGWRVYRRDQQAAGSVLAAAIAYRMFVWLLPLALVLVGGLGLYASAADEDAEQIAEGSLGRYLADSVAAAATGTSTLARIVIVVSGTVIFLYESYVLLRTLRAVSSFTWGIPVRPLRHAPVATLVFLALLLGAVVVAALIAPIQDLAVPPFGLLIALASLLVLPAFYMLTTLLLLPHGARHWTDLVPGAVLFYVAVTLIHMFNVLILYPWVARKEETYGVLGVAAGLLFSLFVVGRAFELSSALNAVLLADRRGRRRGRAPAGARPADPGQTVSSDPPR
jgi:uncharacterized BrkB/YihY/UPF0761 family membrane protein